MPKSVMLGCTLLDAASLYSETYLNRDHSLTKRPKRIRIASWRRAARKPSKVTQYRLDKLDIEL